MRQPHKTRQRLLYVTYIWALILIVLPIAYGFGVGTLDDSISYYADEDTSIDYFLVNAPSTDFPVAIIFEGSLNGYTRIQQDNHDWYSGRLSEFTATLTREFDLTNVSNATLRFNTEYYIENGWDFGYVRVSTDNGSTWTQLQGVSTTTYRHPSASFGLPGSHSFTGTTNGLYQPEVMDLTPFVGNSILLRFSYHTDTGFLRPGWHVDDISIPEIGFFDDVEGFNTTWENAGWYSNFISQDSGTRVEKITLEMNIPSGFNASEDSFMISTLIVGENAAATTSILERLPPLVQLFVPSPPRGGGGGGSPIATEDIKVISPKGIVFTKTSVVPGVLNVANFNHAASHVMSVEFRMEEHTSNIEIRVYALSGRPSSTTVVPDVFTYFELDTRKIDDKKVSDAKIRFRVSKSWLDDNGHYLFDITLSRFHDGEWDDLPTRLISNDGEYYYYEARTPGFSFFAIRVAGKEALPVEVTDELKEAIDLEVVVEGLDNVSDGTISETGLTSKEKESIQLEVVDEKGRRTIITEGKKKEALRKAQVIPEEKEERVTNIILILILLAAGVVMWVYRAKPGNAWTVRTRTARTKNRTSKKRRRSR